MIGAPHEHIALGEGDEFDAIRRMLEVWGPDLARGIGDDAALIAFDSRDGQLVASTDASVEEVHFRRGWLTPREIGARAAAAALSDLAAMAATPLGLLLALGVPESWRAGLEEIARGVGELAASVRCPIVGGNITRAAALSLTITVLGRSPRPLRRDGVRNGDALYVTGRLGGPGAALGALLHGATPDPRHRERFAAPRPRIDEARWLAERGATAAIDISDGLSADAAHLASASALRLELDLAAIPCVGGVAPERAVGSGEEYELLVAFGGDALPDVAAFAAEFDLPLTRVGRAVAGKGVEFIGPAGRVDPPRGHDHLT